MKTPRHKIADFLTERSLEADTDSQELAKEVAAYLIETGRTSELTSLSRDVIEKRAEKGIVEVTAVSAHPLSPELQNDIEARIKIAYPEAKTVIINQETDPDAIGGIRLELANQQLDLTVRSKLNRFKQLTTSGKD